MQKHLVQHTMRSRILYLKNSALCTSTNEPKTVCSWTIQNCALQCPDNLSHLINFRATCRHWCLVTVFSIPTLHVHSCMNKHKNASQRLGLTSSGYTTCTMLLTLQHNHVLTAAQIMRVTCTLLIVATATVHLGRSARFLLHNPNPE